MSAPEEPRPRRESRVSIEQLLAHERFVRQLARAITRDTDAASDLVQETWAQALERPPRHGENVRAWLAIVLRRASWRKRRSAPQEWSSPDEPVDPSEPADALTDADVRAAIAQALAELSEPLREVVRLRFFDGLPPREIARELGVPVSTVNSRLQRALARLRGRLDRRLGAGAWLLVLVGRERAMRARPIAARATTAASLAAASAVVLVVLATRAAEPGERLAAAAGAPAAARAAELVPAERESRAPVESAPQPAPPPAVAIEVRVVDPRGKPIEGARVFGLGPYERVELGATDALGRLLAEVEHHLFQPRIGSSADGRVGLEALHPSWAGSDLCYVLPECASAEIALPPSPVDLRGHVRDTSGAPVAGAAIELRRDPLVRVEGDALVFGRREFAQTDDAGAFVLERVAARAGPLHVAAEGFVLQRAHWSGRGADALEVVLDRGARVEGTVRDASGASVPSAVVSVGWRNEPSPPTPVTCDENGRYVLEGVQVGRAHLLAGDVLRPDHVATQHVKLVAGRTATWDPVLAQSGGLVVELVDEAGAPLADWLVNVASADGYWREMLLTDAAGRIVRHAVPAGAFTVLVIGLRSALDGASAGPVAAAQVAANGEPQRVVVRSDPPSGSITGVLDSSPLGRDLDPRVTLRQAGGTLAVEAELDPRTGRFSATRLLPGTWIVCGTFGSLGSVLFATVSLDADEARDLGDLSAPQVAHLDLDWDVQRGDRLVIKHVLADTVAVAVELSTPPQAPVAIAPGDVFLLLHRAGKISSDRVQIEPGSVRTIEVIATK